MRSVYPTRQSFIYLIPITILVKQTVLSTSSQCVFLIHSGVVFLVWV
jgi:hypothetical protein